MIKVTPDTVHAVFVLRQRTGGLLKDIPESAMPGDVRAAPAVFVLRQRTGGLLKDIPESAMPGDVRAAIRILDENGFCGPVDDPNGN